MCRLLMSLITTQALEPSSMKSSTAVALMAAFIAATIAFDLTPENVKVRYVSLDVDYL